MIEGMKVLERVVYYVLVIFHAPWTLIRVFVALITLVDAWCDKIINKAISESKES